MLFFSTYTSFFAFNFCVFYFIYIYIYLFIYLFYKWGFKSGSSQLHQTDDSNVVLRK